MKRILYYTIILIMILSVPIQFFLWRTVIEPRWGTIQVVQASTQIERGQIIGEENIEVVNVPSHLIVDGEVTNPQQIIGQETTRIIRKGERITKDMLNFDGLVPGPDEYNMPMPTEWVLAMPGSMLRGDRISLYPVKNESDVTLAPDGTVVEMAASDIPDRDLELLQDILVSFSKASNNQEVTASDDRKNPSANVSRFEMIVTKEQRDLITEYGSNGYKFIVTYR